MWENEVSLLRVVAQLGRAPCGCNEQQSKIYVRSERKSLRTSAVQGNQNTINWGFSPIWKCM